MATRLRKGRTTNSNDKLQSQISNYRTRLNSIGRSADSISDNRNWLEKLLNLEEDQNVLFDIFEIIDRPRNALFTAVDEAAQGGNALEGLWQGFSGQTDTSGKDLLVNNFDMEDEEGNLDLADVLGFGLDLVGDPTNWVTFGGKTALDVVSDAALKGAKKLGKFADSGIVKGLNALDAREVAKVTKLAGGADNVDDFLETIGLSSKNIGNRAQSYAKFKTATTDIFNQGATTLGKLKKAARRTSGSNQLVRDALKPFTNSLEDLSYNYVIKNSDNVAKYADDLADLTNYISKEGNTVAKWIEKNTDKELASILKQEQSVVAEDILNMMQKGKNTSVRSTDINEFLKTGKFEGSEESVKQIVDLINSTADKRAGLVVKDIRPQVVSSKYQNQIRDLTDTIKKVGKDTAEGKAAQDKLDEILRLNSSLEIGDTTTLKELAKNPRFQEELRNLDLRYNLEYNVDEWNRLRELESNEAFMELFEQNKGAYKELSNRLKELTGRDYSDIVDRAGYVRKAKGTADNKVTDEVFGVQKYRQPAVVANRQYQEQLRKDIASIDVEVTKLKKSVSRESTDSLVSQIKKVDAKNTKVENLGKRIEKYGDSLENIDTKITKTNENLQKTSAKIDDNIIKKSKKIQDQSVTNQFAKKLTEVNSLKKQLTNLTKQLTKADDSSIKTVMTNLDNVQAQLTKANDDLIKLTATIDGHVDDTIIKELEANVKNINKYVEETRKLDKLTASKNATTEKLLKTTEQVDTLTTELNRALKNIDFKLENINPANDDYIYNRIKTLEKSKSLLESQVGKDIFSLNYYAGLEDFIKNVELTNKNAALFNEALTLGVFNDPNVIKTIDADDIPENWVKVSGGNVAARLNSVENIMGDFADKEGLASLKAYLKENNTFYMEPRVASLFSRVSTKSKDVNALVNMVDKFNNVFKKYSTLSPGYLLRNFTGNMFNSYLSGMPVSQIVPYTTKATKLLNKTDDLIQKVAKGGEAALSEVDLQDWNLIKQFYEGGFSRVGTAARDLESVQESFKLGGKYNIVNKASQGIIKANEATDAVNRMALLMYANDDVAKGGKYLSKLGVETPIDAVKYALMDPSNLSETEQNVIKKIIPFYTFTKQNLMFQATNLIKNTAKYRNVMKALEDSYNDLGEDSYYDYQKSNMQIPIPWATDDEGNQLFLKTNLPLSDLGEILENPLQRVVSSTTPLIRTPFELATGTSTFTGQPLNYDTATNLANTLGIELGAGVQNTAEVAEALLNGLGLQNVSTNVIKKVQTILESAQDGTSGQDLWSEIFRSILQSTNAENVRTSGLYDELEAYQAEIERLKDQGIDVPTIKELTASNSIKANRLKTKRTRLK